MTTPGEGGSEGRPTGEPASERPYRRAPLDSAVGRQESAIAATGTGAATGDEATGAATTPGLVVTEERLADGRHITYFGISR